MTCALRASLGLAVLAAGLGSGCHGVAVPYSSQPGRVADSPPDVRQAVFAADQGFRPVPTAAISAPAPTDETNASVADLEELQRLAFEISPSLRQAMADVAAARGAAIQAGLNPNPTVGYQGDQMGSGHTAGQQGVFLNQTFVTYGKLGLAQAAAMADVTRAEVALRQAQADLRAQIRARYFALRTATESVRVGQEMARTAAALADRQQKLLASGQPVAPHEVDQAQALAKVAGGELINAQNRQRAAVEQLATLTGRTNLAVANAPFDDALPVYSFDQLVGRVLQEHTELQSAAALVERSRLQLELARMAPYPNVETNTYLQQDYQTRTAQVGLQVGVALPVFDRNQGNIAQAEANLVRATHEAARVRQDLRFRLAEVFERYTTNRRLLVTYREEVLPAQLKAFDGIRKRFEQEPGRVSFSEVVLAQQTLASTYASYLNYLSAAWQATADLGRLAQSDESAKVQFGSGADSWPDPPAGPK
jgi:cobalt-zinc-cadmium efflux system outer membrane protein